uniref:Pentacotripeptide-repeat region of PRORP domain-containing protein n=1 Tax=Gossypium raimondii TaxID=29730 RepID=A0A0D2QSW8_GOSRA|nr:hypothetical protein B456_003G131800 [Gossypium raimondii]KJB20077.1 hypothetical protein B456_003G131800 [Gossypium raimondii]
MLQSLTLIPKLAKNPPLKALSLFNSSILQGLQHTPESISFTLHILLSSNLRFHSQSLLLQIISGRISSPFFTPSSLFHYLTQHCFSPNSMNQIRLYESIINAHVQSQLPDQAIYYFNQMVDKNFVVGPNTFNGIMDFLIKFYCFEKAWTLFQESKGRVKLDVYSFGILIKGCCEAGDLGKSFELLDQIEELGLAPNVVIYTTLIDGCCKNGDLEQAKLLFAKMEELGLVPNEYTYTVLINGLFKRGLENDGLELYEKMQLMKVYCSEGKVGKAFEMFDEMRERGVACNVVTYNILIGGLCREKRLREAEKLVDQMKRTGLSPNLITYNSLIDGFCNVGKLEKARYLFGQLKTKGQSPSLVTYNILISAFSRAKDSTTIAKLVKEMEERGIRPSKKAGLGPDVYTYGVLIHGLCIKGNMKDAWKLFTSMDEMQLKPNDVIYNTMVHGYCKQGSSYRALRLLQEMKEKRLVPNVASYNSTIGVLCKDGKWQEAEALVTEMVESGFKPTVSIYNLISEIKNNT